MLRPVTFLRPVVLAGTRAWFECGGTEFLGMVGVRGKEVNFGLGSKIKRVFTLCNTRVTAVKCNY